MSDSPPPHASMLENPLFPPRPTDLAHTILREAIRPGDTVIDATAGNGHDTVFLAEIVGSNGRVLAFDIQASAIEAARTRASATQVTASQLRHGHGWAVSGAVGAGRREGRPRRANDCETARAGKSAGG